MDSAGKNVRPGMQSVPAPSEAGPARIDQELRGFVVEIRGTKSSDDVAFKSQPFIAVVGEGSMQTAEVGVEGAGTEKNVFESNPDLNGVPCESMFVNARERFGSRSAGCGIGGEGKGEERS